MGLFDKKERLNILEKTQVNLEQTQRNLDAINQLVLLDHKDVSCTDVESDSLKLHTIDEKDMTPLQAAYALNLCTVSVTQIIDYMDLNVMEQEYDMILNNLNLQNMPDDDALLTILKQILNTVTFFKIDQKEREFVERDYQQKMRNAVWSAVPNVGALIATGLSQGPAMMAVSLTASVGTAYMSYRKQKAENKNEYDKEMWKLEKSAIEQFDGLKRELFDTAWRLSKRFMFDDKFRLSERQIHQYNSILMDSDNDRRYARLEAISDDFIAYPPFWHQFGHTANLVALEANKVAREKEMELDDLEARTVKSSDNVIYERILCVKQEIRDVKMIEKDYQERAKQHFEFFHEVNTYGLLREDKIASMCNLEYVELMIQTGDFNKRILVEKLNEAAKKAGNSLEVLQLCVFAYMKLGEADLAEKYLKMLVNEDYNCIMNAQILSSLYVHHYFNNIRREDARWNYSILTRRVSSEYLFPMPSNPNIKKEDLEKQFIFIQKYALLQKYEAVLNELTKKYAMRFNRCIPRIDSIKYDEHSFEDSFDRRSKMKEQIIRFIDRNKNDQFRTLLMQEDIFEEYTIVLQEYFSKLIELIEDRKNPLSNFNYQCLQEDLLHPFSQHSDEITNFRLTIQNPDVDQKQLLSNLFNNYNFLFFTKEMLYTFVDMVTAKVESLLDMNEISCVEAVLLQFCEKNTISLPFDKLSSKEVEEQKGNFLLEQLMGSDEYKKMRERNALRTEIISIIIKHLKEDNIIKRENKSRFYVRNQNENEMEIYLRKVKGYKSLKSDVLAVIEEKGLSDLFNNTDLWFTTEGLVIVKSDKFSAKYTPYSKVQYVDSLIVCNGLQYSNTEDVDIDAMWDLIKEIQKITEEQDLDRDLQDVDYAEECFEALEENESFALTINV